VDVVGPQPTRGVAAYACHRPGVGSPVTMTHVSGLSGGAGRIDEGSLPRGPGNGEDGVPALVAGGGDGLRAAGGVLRDGAVELGILEFAGVGCIGCRRHRR
jgi:hypothetical protein